MKAEGTLTEADILMELVDPSRPTLSPQVAQEFLALKFNDDATNRIRELLDKNNAGAITLAEKSTLGNYLRVGEFLDLIQAKARVACHPSRPHVEMLRYGVRHVRIVVCRHGDKEYDSGEGENLQYDVNSGAFEVVNNGPVRPHGAALYGIPGNSRDRLRIPNSPIQNSESVPGNKRKAV